MYEPAEAASDLLPDQQFDGIREDQKENGSIVMKFRFLVALGVEIIADSATSTSKLEYQNLEHEKLGRHHAMSVAYP